MLAIFEAIKNFVKATREIILAAVTAVAVFLFYKNKEKEEKYEREKAANKVDEYQREMENNINLSDEFIDSHSVDDIIARLRQEGKSYTEHKTDKNNKSKQG